MIKKHLAMLAFSLVAACSTSQLIGMQTEVESGDGADVVHNPRSLQDLCCTALFPQDIKSIEDQLHNFDLTNVMTDTIKKLREIEEKINEPVQIIECLKQQLLERECNHHIPPARKRLISFMIELGNGFCVSGGSNGTVQIWEKKSPDNYICHQMVAVRGRNLFGEGPWVQALVALENGFFAAWSDDMTATIWSPDENHKYSRQAEFSSVSYWICVLFGRCQLIDFRQMPLLQVALLKKLNCLLTQRKKTMLHEDWRKVFDELPEDIQKCFLPVIIE